MSDARERRKPCEPAKVTSDSCSAEADMILQLFVPSIISSETSEAHVLEQAWNRCHLRDERRIRGPVRLDSIIACPHTGSGHKRVEGRSHSSEFCGHAGSRT